MFCASFFILSQGSADGVEQIGLMVKDGQAEEATEASEEAGGGGAQIEQVEKIIRIARELGIEPATPSEARKILSLKGIHNVNF